ncbi:Cytochrome c5 [Pseudomonas brenneri]|uniref:Cytochrome c5 n=3 Tax=Pseudomonas TaxID=286 RepID=A0ABY0WI62_9PSED|nr:Cytochrome c5 [Pseudomonas sp. 25 R 14]SDV08171.1 Cytochrome c5 [Pseudomonas brenneri]
MHFALLNLPLDNRVVSVRRPNRYTFAACETVAAGVNSHHEGERVNLIMKMLAVPATVLALWAASAQAATNDDIAKRLEPVGKVCIQGEECKGMEVAVTAGGGGAKTPDEIIAKHCNACHSTGLLGAPKIGDTAAWKERADHQGGLDGILAKAITGINAMPPKGTCADCSDADLKGAIEKMSGLK